MRFIFALPVLVLLACCAGNSRESDNTDTLPENTPKKTTDTAKPVLPADAQLTAFSRFIAGMPNNLQASKRSATWTKSTLGNDEKWNTLQQRIGNPIEKWVNTAGLEQPGDPKTLFYPFAGGDFYYAHLFFPKADTTIMIGLEPTGTVFNPDAENDSALMVYLQNLPNSLFFPHRLGFFRTKSMAVDFRKGLLNGTLHTVLFYMARFNANIHYIRHFNLDSAGIEISLNTQGIAYRVGYSLKGDNRVRELVYFSYDVSNAGLARQPMLMKWLNNRGKVLTFFKAASYLMHYTSFSTLRDFVNTHTVRLMQDDSGLPYAFMLGNGFDVKLLGRYTRTIPLFAKEFQPDLKAAYGRGNVDSLPFLIGYNAQFRECNLQSARKKR
ncbi:MAG: hypothetical protein ACK5FT_02475 [Sphingomonadales bacterium]|jgi:hypothetical protein